MQVSCESCLSMAVWFASQHSQLQNTKLGMPPLQGDGPSEQLGPESDDSRLRPGSWQRPYELIWNNQTNSKSRIRWIPNPWTSLQNWVPRLHWSLAADAYPWPGSTELCEGQDETSFELLEFIRTPVSFLNWSWYFKIRDCNHITSHVYI